MKLKSLLPWLCVLGLLIGLVWMYAANQKKEAELALLIMLDGSNVLSTLCENVARKYGKRRGAEILGDYRPPPFGTPPKQMPKSTSDFLDRLETGVGPQATREILLKSPHAGPPSAYADDRKMLRASKDVDEYLRRRHEGFVEELREHMVNGTLFFNQKIDRDVLDFVKGNPEIGGGVRRGKTIYCTKVPYMAIEYLREKDKRRKRYYYCHCPLARESITSGRKMSRNLCYCSAGFEKAPFEAAFGEPVKVRVLKSALWGDSLCRFALEIPEGYRKD